MAVALATYAFWPGVEEKVDNFFPNLWNSWVRSDKASGEELKYNNHRNRVMEKIKVESVPEGMRRVAISKMRIIQYESKYAQGMHERDTILETTEGHKIVLKRMALRFDDSLGDSAANDMKWYDLCIPNGMKPGQYDFSVDYLPVHFIHKNSDKQ